MEDSVTTNFQSDLENLNRWLDQFSLSRPKRNISKDFADGVLVSEIIQHKFPKLVEIHNYNPANGLAHKKSNWETLNRKVLSRLNYVMSKTEMEQILTGKNGVIENFLLKLKQLLENHEKEKASKSMGDSAESQSAESMSYQLFSDETSQPTFIPGVLLAEKEKEILCQRETIQMLQARISRLEELLIIKEKQVQELTSQIAQLKLNKKN